VYLTAFYYYFQTTPDFNTRSSCLPDGYECNEGYAFNPEMIFSPVHEGPSCTFCCTVTTQGTIGGPIGRCGYQKATAPYLGCYNLVSATLPVLDYFINVATALAGSFLEGNSFERSTCEAACYEKLGTPQEEIGIGTFGLAEGGRCWCSWAIPPLQPVDGSECDVRCAVDSAQSCGNGCSNDTTCSPKISLYSLRPRPNQVVEECKFWANRLTADEDKKIPMAAIHSLIEKNGEGELQECFVAIKQQRQERDSGILFFGGSTEVGLFFGGSIFAGFALDVDNGEIKMFTTVCGKLGLTAELEPASPISGFLINGGFDDFEGWGVEVEGSVEVVGGVSFTVGATASIPPLVFIAIGVASGAGIDLSLGGCNTRLFEK
jgi:hypothetical protein